MRLVFLILLLAPLSPAQYRLYTAMVTAKGFIVGLKLLPSGLFFQAPSGEWQQIGFNHPNIMGVDYDPRDPSTLYLAAGNGLIRAANSGRDWKILTSYDVTELRDLAVDRNAPGTIYFAHCAGIRVTHDGGTSWQAADHGLRRKYTESIRVDRRKAGRIVSGGEDGLFVSGDGGESWRRAGAAGFQIMHVQQSPHDACFWLAVTQQGGIFASTDCAESFENLGNVGVGDNLYDVAFDPASAERIAVCGWGPGVVVSEDRGKTWTPRNEGLPSTGVWSVAFDPAHAGRVYASVHQESLFVSDDSGRHWRKGGLPGSAVYRMVFGPEGGAR